MVHWKAIVLYIVLYCVFTATGEDIWVFKFEPNMLTDEYDSSLVKFSANQNVGYLQVKQEQFYSTYLIQFLNLLVS